MRDYQLMWRMLRRMMQEDERAVVSRIVSGSKDRFEFYQGALIKVQELIATMNDIEKQAVEGTLEEPDNAG
jgi:ribosomal protein L19